MDTCDCTRQVLDAFKTIASIPRQSKHEELVSKYLCDWAKTNGFAYKTDAAANVIISVPATPGYESAPTIVLQGHMDMVCEKTADSTHDFAKDPIAIVEEDGWIHADRTSLGADDGLGVALALVVALDKEASHPALELLFTTDEEMGMTGANALQNNAISGKILLNLDSEDEGIFTVGCAGGRETKSTVLLYTCAVPQGWKKFDVHISGLYGGHSGTDIHLGRAHALKLAARLLRALFSCAPEIMLKDLHGGTVHNAIPRDAYFTVVTPEAVLPALNKVIEHYKTIFASEYKNTLDQPTISVSVEQNEGDAFDSSSSEKVIDLIYAFPHGVATMSHDIEGLVETSCNLAVVKIDGNRLRITSSQRSSVASHLDAVTGRIEACVRLANGVAVSNKGYPAWQPNMDSELLQKCREVYKTTFDKDPKVEIIHAGLECGIIGAKFRGMDMISFGPTVVSPHSASEKAEIDSITKCYLFLRNLLASYK